MQTNRELELARQFVELTSKNIFLTGKAGTGKTTFLHNLKNSSPKRMAIVAPTGVAAINAGGVTIHSFFQLPFGPYIPGKGVANSAEKLNQKISREKINTIRSIDLLVIDEISMVRADLLDSMDEVLRRYKNHSKPFGGVQLLMIGDLHQLSPVVKNDEWPLLKDYYPNLYFFNSHSLRQTSPVSIELKHIYRQSDSTFINLLNCIRDNKIDAEVLEKLNQRYVPDFKPEPGENYITLTTHNRTADEINLRMLEELASPSKTFKAQIKDNFPESSYPNALELEFKEGAQVMFVKNDPSKEKLFYNGKIGVVTRLTDELVFVKCPTDLVEIPVPAMEWQNIKYVLNSDTKEIDEQVIGTFTQHPLKLAWAITVHKSQGLTFDKAIIDAGASFAHGQVYVALSRCKTFEGIVLRTPLSQQSIRTDSTVSDYSRKADENAPDENYLEKSKEEFQQSLLYDLFDFTVLKSRLADCIGQAQQNDNILNKDFLADLEKIKSGAEDDIYKISESFRNSIPVFLTDNKLVEGNVILEERIKKASAYFTDKLEKRIEHPLEVISFETDNKAVHKKIDDAIAGLRKEVFIKLQLMKLCGKGFKTLDFLKTIADSETDYKNKQLYINNLTPANTNVNHPELSQALKNWRDKTAKARNLPVYGVLTLASISEIVTKLPMTIPMLSRIKGIGKAKIKQFGLEILEIIVSYANMQDDAIDEATEDEYFAPIAKKKEKGDTMRNSLSLYKNGKSIAEIATERKLSISTIQNHLITFIANGEIEASAFVSDENLEKICRFIDDIQPSNITEIVSGLNNEVSFSEVRAAIEWKKLQI